MHDSCIAHVACLDTTLIFYYCFVQFVEILEAKNYGKSITDKGHHVAILCLLLYVSLFMAVLLQCAGVLLACIFACHISSGALSEANTYSLLLQTPKYLG